MAATDISGPTEPDHTTVRIERAIALAQQRQVGEARAAISEIWAELGTHGDPLHRCLLAHHMADVQDDPRDELDWDLRALQAAESITDARVAEAGAHTTVAGLYPSLHLNLGEDYRKLGNAAAARRHLDLGKRAVPSLGDDPYARMIKSGLDGLAQRLAADTAGPPARR